MLVNSVIDVGGLFVDSLLHEPGDADRIVRDSFRVGARRSSCGCEVMERPSTNVGLGPFA